MKKIFVIYCIDCWICSSKSPNHELAKVDYWEKIYRGSYSKTNELVHTKLDVKFDYAKAWMYGKAWITLKPHFYATDSLTLDAKGMDIKEVAIMKGAAKIESKI